MKKIVLFSAAILTGASSFAQNAEKIPAGMTSDVTAVEAIGQMKTTKLSDTARYYNSKNSQVDSSYVSYYDQVTPVDSGFIYGTNFKNDKGFAEQYNFNFKTDTSFSIIGIYAAFSGKYNASTSRTINFKIWNRGAQVAAGTKKFLTGYPNTALKTLSWSIKSLGMNNGSASDTFKTFYFGPTASSWLTGVNYPFYVGYEIPSYTWASVAGDTFTVRSSYPGRGVLIGQYTVNTALDSLITTRNAIQTSAGAWEDAYWIRGSVRNLSMVPVLRIQSSVSVQGLTRNNLTFYGHYPNPASKSINVKYSLGHATGVTISIMDVTGRPLSTVQENAGPGEHVKNVSIADLPAGNYLYMVRTAEGDGMAAQFTVIK